MKKAQRSLVLALSLIAASSVASGYYNWIFFAHGSGPFIPIPAKLNLSAVQNNTVSYFISNQAPSVMMPGDDFQSLISQIQAAANVWNQVPTSTIRLAFGGMETVGATQQNTPGIDVVFDDDMPVGLLAQTRVTLPSDVSSIVNVPSVFISRSKVQLRSDLTVYQQASYYDSFFLTIAHEFGHAMGLQHTLTSGLMATPVTSATSKAAPLSADDIAGISMLYPVSGYGNITGAISGVVLQNGTGVNLASVVALSSNGIAISGLTNPDGTYFIGGVPPGQYYVYTHPLPPAAQGEGSPDNIYPPETAQQVPFPANTGMDTQFFSSTGGTRDWTKAGVVTVNAAGVAANVNFPNMQVRSGPALYAIETYGYPTQSPTQVPLPTPYLVSGLRLFLTMAGPTLTPNGGLLPGLAVSAIGPAAFTEANTLAYYAPPNGFVGADLVLDTNTVQGPTPVALAFTVPNDLYVLPQAFTVVANAAPAISSVSATGAVGPLGGPVVTVVGANLNATTQVVFDGAPGTVQSANNDGSLTVAAPPAVANYTASVEALSADQQTSLQPLGITPARMLFTYSGPASPSIKVNYALLRQGTDSEVDIIGTNTNFISGQVAVGFGTSDIVVRRVWVLSPQRILLNVTVAPQAQAGPVELTVVSGLQVETLTSVLQVQAASNPASLRVPIVNTLTGLEGVPAGGSVVITTTGLPQNLSGWTLLIDNLKAGLSPQMIGNNLTVQVPASLASAPGAALVDLIDPNGNVVSVVVMQIDTPPPAIVGVVNSIGVPISSTNPARQGDALTVTVTGLADSASSIAPAAANVNIGVGGVGGVVNQSASALLPGAQVGVTQIQFTLSPSAPYGPQQQLTVGLGTRVSAPVQIAIIPK
jgi:Matrixin